MVKAGRHALRAAVGQGLRSSLRHWERLDRLVTQRLSGAPSKGTAWWVGTPWERVRSAGVFDVGWYRFAYPDLATTTIDPMWHYAHVGADQGRDPNPLFATAWYLSTYPDVAASRLNPLLHFVEHGAGEGRNPGPLFDTSWYLRTNAAVRAAGVNPLGHYLVVGEQEGRRPRPLPGRARGTTSVTVVLVSGEPDTPGHQYRVVRFAEAVRRLGGEATVLNVPEAALMRLAALDQADVVVIWRSVWGPELERVVRRARRAGAVIVFDVDDLMVEPEVATVATIDGIRSQGLTEDEASHWFAKMRRTAKECDVCTCTTPALASRLRRLGKPTYVLPNGFDDETLVRSRLARRLRRSVPHDGICRIGYASGSLTHQRDFALVADPTAEVLRTHPRAHLVVYRGGLDLDEFPAFDDLRAQVEWREIVPLDALPVELSRLDVNLAPLEVGNPFCEAKSDLKFFEAALADVPTIASPTEQHRRVIDDGVNGLLADDDDAWRHALVRLVDDAELRRSMGRSAHRSVLWAHGPGRRTQAVKAVLDQLLDADLAADAFELEFLRARRPEAPPPALVSAVPVVEHDRLGTARVTVVIPVHDYRALVTEALESVGAQTLPDLDLVVVDDGSTDDSLEVVRAWLDTNAARFNRVLLLSHAARAGVALARNAGFDAAETPFVLALDADNALLPDCCERLLEALDGSAAAFSYPRILHVGETSELLESGDVRGYLPFMAQRLIASNYIDAMALIRKDAWVAAGGYREGLLGWEDYDLWCRFAELGLYGKQVAEDLALYRIHDASMLHTVTHGGDRLAEVHEAITREHPWLRLESTEPVGDACESTSP
ncbi:MAG: glycosyltransferase, partial [Actinomycetota bacterium]|nr:glycosyltransferase [Actinomycetota bacterium]